MLVVDHAPDEPPILPHGPVHGETEPLDPEAETPLEIRARNDWHTGPDRHRLSSSPDRPRALAQDRAHCRGDLLLPSQHLAAGQKSNRLLQTPEFRFLALGGLDPGVITPA